MTGKQVHKQSSKQDEPEDVEAAQVETSEVDDLLDDIDSVLEANSQAFVEEYVQKGGQ